MIIPYLAEYPSWMTRAACAGMNGDNFFPRKGDNRAAKAAKKVCGACPVTTQCLAWALAYEDNTGTAYRSGVYGGTSAYERRQITRRTNA